MAIKTNRVMKRGEKDRDREIDRGRDRGGESRQSIWHVQPLERAKRIITNSSYRVLAERRLLLQVHCHTETEQHSHTVSEKVSHTHIHAPNSILAQSYSILSIPT